MKKNLLLLFSLGLLLGLTSSQPIAAVSASEFDPGNIISDSVFFNKDSMTVSEIQAFLESQVPVCDTNGDGFKNGVRRRNVSASNPPPYICLKDYKENPDTKENNLDGNVPSGAKSAAQIIWDSAQEYGINPQVLIVTLQKEQGLVTDVWPWEIQYRKAMGYGCPDTAPCDAQYYGFANQVNRAAFQFRRYVTFPQNYNFAVGNRYVGYHPNSSCGGTTVNIKTSATAALYNYTPYQPNSASLNAWPGSGNGCSSYGNRNFWFYFNDWFGSTNGTPFFRVDNGKTVYILGEGDTYYRIPSREILEAYGFGKTVNQVSSFSSSFLEDKTSAGSLPLIARFEGGAIYLIDEGQRKQFLSREMYEETYGYTMGDEARLPESFASLLPNSSPVRDVVQVKNSPKIYFVNNGLKRHISSSTAYTENNNFYASKPKMSASSLFTNSLSEGNPILESGLTFKIGQSNRIYVTGSNDTYSWIPNPEVANDLKLDIKNVRLFSETTVSDYTYNGPLYGFISKPFDQAWSVANGIRRHVSEEQLSAEKYALDFTTIHKFSNDFVTRYKSNDPLQGPIRSDQSPRIYIIENGEKRWVTSRAALNNQGYDVNDAITVSQSVINLIPNGSNIN